MGKRKPPERSFRKAVNDKCKDCIYDKKSPGSWVAQVSLCSARECPLWDFRPRIRKNGYVSKYLLDSYQIERDDPVVADLAKYRVECDWDGTIQERQRQEEFEADVERGLI